MANHIVKRNGYQIVTYSDRKVLYKEAFEAFELIDTAYAKLYGTVPLTPAVIKDTIDNYIPVVNLDWICSVKDTDGKIIGFGIMVPSIAKALKKSNGKMFPFGFIRLLKALQGKNDTLEMFLVAVDPAYQLKGIPAIIINTLLQHAIDQKIQICETGPQLETNTAIHSMFSHFEPRQHKRRRCYIKSI